MTASVDLQRNPWPAHAPSRARAGRLDSARRELAHAVFREWLDRTGDPDESARRAGVSTRTGRRWRLELQRIARHANSPGRAGEPAATFIGRHREIEALHRLVRAGHRRVAVIGMGGIGKTRLALRYAALFGPTTFPGGVYPAALAHARTPDDVTRLVAGALGLELAAGCPVGAALASRGPALVILDDVDGCARAASALVAAWSRAAPAAVLLSTSRLCPALPGGHAEHALVGGGPEALAGGADAILELGPLPAEPEGVELFVARAHLVAPALRIDRAARGELAELVQRLDGNPLAIELAAARCGLLGLAELRVRLDARFELLAAPAGGAESRAAPSLLSCIERSWAVLGPAEQVALSECTVFHGSFSLRAAERVLSGDRVADRLAVLRAHSLLRAAAPGRGGVPRFSIDESVRALAAARLRHAGAVYARHAACLLDATDRLDAADLEDLRAIHARALAEPADLATALRALTAMQPLLMRTGPLTEYRAALDATIARVEAAARAHPPAASALGPALLARALAARARVRRGQGDLDGSEADAASAAELAQTCGDRVLAARLHRDRGRTAHVRGDLDGARARYEAASRAFAAIGDARREAHVHSLLSDLATSQARDAEAEAHGERARALLASQPEPESRARALYIEGGHHFRAGQLAEARRCWEATIALLSELGDHHFEGYARCNLGIALGELGRFASAREQLVAALARFSTAGYRRAAAVVTGYLGALEHRIGHVPRARDHYERALAVLSGASNLHHAGVFRACLATAHAQLGAGELAGRELARARELLCELGDPKALTALALHERAVALALAPGEPAAVAAAAAALAALAPACLISDDVRLAQDLLGRALGPGGSAVEPRDVWWVAEDGSGFECPGGPRVDLRARRALARIVAALGQLHADRPGASLSTDALFACGWPGERALPGARINRVNVALVTLRKLGLRALLERTATGYRFDAAAPIELSLRVADPAPGLPAPGPPAR